MPGYLRYIGFLLVGVLTVCPVFLVVASEPVRRIPSDTPVPSNFRPNFRYIVPAAMQEPLPFDEATPTVPPITQEPATTETPIPKPLISEQIIPEPQPVTNDPFRYNFPEGDIGIPRNISSLPSGIQVVGILIFKNQKSIAAIRIPKTGNQRVSDIYYIHEGDVIEVPGNLLPNRRPSGSRGTDDSAVLFLVVEKITSQHVEVRSRSNIADKHIIR
ncbi:MAG: hypothetical protein LBK82_10950 [Planctomycetaceae bacterium]|nr:hypothetical protein [Planctomycetaceae bacterium]